MSDRDITITLSFIVIGMLLRSWLLSRIQPIAGVPTPSHRWLPDSVQDLVRFAGRPLPGDDVEVLFMKWSWRDALLRGHPLRRVLQRQRGNVVLYDTAVTVALRTGRVVRCHPDNVLVVDRAEPFRRMG